MISEIGIVVTLYVVLRVIPSRWPRVTLILSLVTGLVGGLVAADLAVRAVSDRSVFSYLTVARKEGEQTVTETKSADAQHEEEGVDTVAITRDDGGSITTHLGYGVAVAKGSSLHREWIAVHDSSFPVDLSGTPGVKTIFEAEKYGGEYRYRADFEIATKKAVQAVEVRFLTFDVWGNHVQSLAYEEVVDIPAGENRRLKGEWRIFSENDVEKHYASIAYIARARLADGQVREAKEAPILEEARRFSAKFTAADLEPEEPKGK